MYCDILSAFIIVGVESFTYINKSSFPATWKVVKCLPLQIGLKEW